MLGLCGPTKVVSRADRGSPQKRSAGLLCPLFQNEVAPFRKQSDTPDRYINFSCDHVKTDDECTLKTRGSKAHSHLL